MKTVLHRVALVLTLIGLVGCNSLTGDALSSIRHAITGTKAGITPEHINAIAAPSLHVQFGQSEALLVSPGESAATGRVEWHGRSEMLLTQGGRVTQSAGLATDLLLILPADDPLLTGLHTIHSGLTVTRTVDYPGRYLTGLLQHSRYRVGGVKTLEIMGTRYRLRRVDERIHIPELGFKATNHYWIESDTGLVRQSVQHLSPDLPPMKLTLTKAHRSRP